MLLSNKKLTEVNQLTISNVQAIYSFYSKPLIRQNILNTVSNIIATLSPEQFDKLLFTDEGLDTFPLSVRKKFMNIYSMNSNYIYTLLTGIWTESFDLGIKHTIADSLDYLISISNKVNFSNCIEDIAEFAKNKKKSKDLDDYIKYLKRYGSKVLETLGVSNSRKISEISTTQKIKYFEAVEDISTTYRKAQVKRQSFVSSNYINTRKRVLSRDYARRYDQEIKNSIRDFIKSEGSLLKNLRGSVNNIKDLERRIKGTLDSANFMGKVKDNSSTARKIIRTELVLAYNFGKLAGFATPEDMGRQMRWNADWELQSKIPGYDVCDYCRQMNGKVFTVRYLLEIGAMQDIGVLSYKGTDRSKTVWKNPRFPTIVAHPNCSCFWTPLPRSESKSNIVAQVGKSLQDTLPVVLGAGLIVTGGFLMARSNAFKEFIKSEGDDLLQEIIKPTSIISNKPKLLDDTLSDIAGNSNIEDIINTTNTPKVESSYTGYRPSATSIINDISIPVSKPNLVETPYPDSVLTKQAYSDVTNIKNTVNIVDNLYPELSTEIRQITSNVLSQ